MAENPIISIITPVWNGIPYIKECVESVLSQEFQDWEMLISDNGSTDGTREYLDTLDDPRIRVFKQPVNLGIFGNLNFLVSKAACPISQMLCHDDHFINEHSLQDIVRAWESLPENVGIVRFNHESVVQCSLTSFQKKRVSEIISPEESDLMFFVFGGSLTGNLSNVSMRTRLHREIGPFSEKFPFAGDFEYWSRLAREVAMSVRNGSVIYVREHPLSASYYQNRKGELIGQASKIVNRLYSNILEEYPNAGFALKLHATINYDSLQRYIGLKLLLKGDKAYLAELDRVSGSSVYLFPKAWRWILFFVTAGGKFGRVLSAKYLINTCAKSKRKFHEPRVSLH